MESPAGSTPSVAGQPDQADHDPSLLVSSFFPSPPADYKHFTARNIELARALVSAHGPRDHAGEVAEWTQGAQQERLAALGYEERPDFDLRELVTPPRVDWIEEQGGWDAFADVWPLDEHLPSLEEMGVRQLYPSGQDRRESLKRLLNTVLATFVQLLDALLKPPPSLSYDAMKDFDPDAPQPTEAQQLIQHIRLACLNMHHLCNELRPVQARETLETMMRQQIDRRKARTEQLRATSGKISQVLADLRGRYQQDAMDVEAPSSELSVARDAFPSKLIQDDSDYQRVVSAVRGLE